MGDFFVNFRRRPSLRGTRFEPGERRLLARWALESSGTRFASQIDALLRTFKGLVPSVTS